MMEDRIARQGSDHKSRSAKGDFPALTLADALAILGDSLSANIVITGILESDPLGNDGWNGIWIVHGCALTLTMIGDQERAISLLDDLLAAPTPFSAKGLAISPAFAPLRDNPRFQALLEKGDVVF
jgi:hypothetical protein